MTRETLLDEARKAAQRAYAPYSHFRVGAALVVETAEGPKVITGANVENASYGLTLCAERAALAAACLVGERASSGKPRVSEIAITCIDAPEDAPDYQRTPCGACRQWLAELAPDAVYYVDGIERDLRLDDLLPLAFRLEGLEAPAKKPVSASAKAGGVKAEGSASKPKVRAIRNTGKRAQQTRTQ